MQKTKALSDCIPYDMVQEIRKNGKENFDQHVYRVAKRGIINEVAFMGSYEEAIYEKRTFKGDLGLIGSYSTSCYLTTKYPLKFLYFLKAKLFKKYPHPVIIHGNTLYGLSQLTRERISDHPHEDHIDWWIYKDNYNKLLDFFSVIEVNEQENKNE